MKDYVLGIAESNDNIVLIQKLRPEEQNGRFNFVGGKVETTDEATIDTMIREFKEETGVQTSKDDWKFVGNLGREADFLIDVFYMNSDKANLVDTQEDEKIFLVQKDVFLHDVEFQKTFMPNLLAMYYLATSTDATKYNCEFFIEYPVFGGKYAP